MDITAIDRWATQGASPLHRAAPASKIIGAALIVASVVIGTDPLLLAGILFAMTGACVALRLPIRFMLPLALYPALFALIFAFAASNGPVTTALIVVKAITAAFAMVVLMFTTPYPQVFSFVQRITPTIVGDALFLTYRSLFILAEKLSNLSRAVRLRAGISSRQPVRSARATTQALGALILYAFDLSQRDYDILWLRGYSGGLRVSPEKSSAAAVDALTIGSGAIALALATSFRWLPLTGYSWIPALAGSVVLGGAFLVQARNHQHSNGAHND